jgi:hypothetical protein
MTVLGLNKINLKKSNKDELYISCMHMHLKSTVFEKYKKEKQLHEVVLTRKGCMHDCICQGKKGRFACELAGPSKELKKYFDYWEKHQSEKAEKKGQK